MNSNYKYILYLILGLAVIVWVQNIFPKPINFSPTYNRNDKIPYGLYVLDHELPKFIAPATIIDYDKTVFEYKRDSVQSKKKEKETWLFIGNSITFDEQSLHQMLASINKGTDVFIFSNNLPYSLLDTLKLGIAYKDNPEIFLKNPYLKTSPFTINQSLNGIEVYDAKNITVLGTMDTIPNFIKKDIGKGSLFLHNQAIVLSNLYLLESNTHLYAENVLSYIQTDRLVWFGKKRHWKENNQSPVRFILQNQELRWAWYLLIFTGICFMFFHSKRKQRIIPVLKPLENTTVEFAKTIANLYYLEKDHKDIMQKMIVYFLEYVRNRWQIDTSTLDETFIEHLHLKAAKDKKDVIHVVTLIHQFRTTTKVITETDVHEMHQSIQKIIKV